MVANISVSKDHTRMIDLILGKRQGHEHTKEQITFLVNGIMDGSIPDYQLSSWLMAVCWQGMSLDETALLTDAMCHSGQVLDLTALGKVVGDKHSTGGVGDKTTLVFVPMLACAGIPMAKLSGRGLGHTGGTIDKLEAIPGFNVDLKTEDFVKQVTKIGMAIGGQTAELAPVDGKIYALRDVTGTVESIPLIAASVMSKKLAAGANLIILDVKCGRGAFMETEAKAIELAKTMSAVGRILKRPVLAVVTDMEQPLGRAVGHTLEVIEAIETLKGNGPDDLHELCIELGALALIEAGKAKTKEEAVKTLEDLLKSGKALAAFGELIEAQGGDKRVLTDYSLMPQAKHKKDFVIPGTGKKWLKHIDGRKIAEAAKVMGAGRTKKGDPINLAVGIVLKAKCGDMLNGGDAICEVHFDAEKDYDAACLKLAQAFTYSDSEVAKPKLIKASIAE